MARSRRSSPLELKVFEEEDREYYKGYSEKNVQSAYKKIFQLLISIGRNTCEFQNIFYIIEISPGERHCIATMTF